MAIALNPDIELGKLIGDRFPLSEEYTDSTRKYLESEKQEGEFKLKALTELRLCKTVELALGTDKNLNPDNPENKIKDEDLSLLKNPERLTILSADTGECYYRIEIPGLKGLEVHMLGDIFVKEHSEPDSNDIKIEGQPKVINPENIYFRAKAIAIGIPGIGYINILERNPVGVDMSIGKNQREGDDAYNPKTRRIRVGEINTAEDLQTLFHELGHFIEYNYILKDADRARNSVLSRLGQVFGLIDLLKRQKDETKLKRFISSTIEEQIVYLKSTRQVNLIELDWNESVRSLNDMDVGTLEMAITRNIEETERFASLYGLSVSEAITQIFDLPDRFVDDAYKHYEKSWRTYDLGRIGAGVSLDVRKVREENGITSQREHEFIIDIERLKANILKVFPDMGSAAPLDRMILGAKIEGKQCMLEFMTSTTKDSRDYYTFSLIIDGEFGSLVYSPVDRLVMVRGRTVEEDFSLTTGDIEGFNDTDKYYKVKSFVESLSRVLENWSVDTCLDFSQIELQSSLLIEIFKNNAQVSSFRDLPDEAIASFFEIGKNEVNPLHKYHILISFIKLAFNDRFPDLEVPNFDDQTGEKLSLEHLDIIKHYAREFLVRSGVSDVPRVNSWNNSDSIRYITMAATLLNPVAK